MQGRCRRILGYARVSSELQARGTSLRDQQEAIRACATTFGKPVTRMFVEAESAVHENFERRDEIRALMADLRRDDLILCHVLDRWSRDAEFTYRSVREILEMKADFFAIADNCDPSTHHGDTMLSIRIMVAREEHKRIKERTVGTRNRLRDAGYFASGLVAFGYKRRHPKGYKGLDKNLLMLDEDPAKKVVRVYRLCVGGKPMTDIAYDVGLSKAQVYYILRCRTYLGEMRDGKGEWIKGRHEAIIDPDLWQRAQSALASRANGRLRGHRKPSQTEDWILRDVARCGRCESKMSSAFAGPHEARRYYYRCCRACTSRFVNVRRVEAKVSPLVLARLVELREEIARGPEPRKSPDVPGFAARIEKLKTRRARLVDAYEDGLMAQDELRQRLAAIDDERLKLEGAQQVAIRPSLLEDRAVRRGLLREVGAIEQAWGAASPVEQRKLVGHLAMAFRLQAEVEPVAIWRSIEQLAEDVAA